MNKNIKGSYAVFSILLLTSVIPHMSVQSFVMILSLVFIIALYMLRSKTALDSRDRISYSYLIKTFWIWSVLYAVGFLVAGIIISTFGDMTAMNEWTQSILEGAMPDENGLKTVVQTYVDANLSLIVQSTIACAIPATLYAGHRLFQGWKTLENKAT